MLNQATCLRTFQHVNQNKKLLFRWTYASSKGAINILTKCMALDMRTGNVRVNSVSPSWIWSPEVAKAAGSGNIHGKVFR